MSDFYAPLNEQSVSFRINLTRQSIAKIVLCNLFLLKLEEHEWSKQWKAKSHFHPFSHITFNNNSIFNSSAMQSIQIKEAEVNFHPDSVYSCICYGCSNGLYGKWNPIMKLLVSLSCINFRGELLWHCTVSQAGKRKRIWGNHRLDWKNYKCSCKE